MYCCTSYRNYSEFQYKIKKEVDLIESRLSVFKFLMLTFIITLFLQHFNVALSIHLKTDVFRYAISDILSQKHLNG